VKTDASHFVETEESRRRSTARVSNVEFTVTGSVLVPITKVPCGPRETAISRD
jgi:hypothetical protein